MAMLAWHDYLEHPQDHMVGQYIATAKKVE